MNNNQQQMHYQQHQMQQQQQHLLPQQEYTDYADEDDHQQSSSGEENQELVDGEEADPEDLAAQKVFMQEQFAQYEQHLQQLQSQNAHLLHEDDNDGDELVQDGEEELSQSDFLGSNHDEEEEGADLEDYDQESNGSGQHQQLQQRPQYQLESEQDGESEENQEQQQYFQHNNLQDSQQNLPQQQQEYQDIEEQEDGHQQYSDDEGPEQVYEDGHQLDVECESQEETDRINGQIQIDTERLRKLQQHLIHNNQDGFVPTQEDDGEEQDGDESSQQEEPISDRNDLHEHEVGGQVGNNWEGSGNIQGRSDMDLSRQIGNCDLSEIQPNTLTQHTGMLSQALNSNSQQDMAFSNMAQHQQINGKQVDGVFPKRSQEFQNVAQFLRQQREEEKLAEEQHQNIQIVSEPDVQGEDLEQQDEEEEDEEDVEIQEMKAKFNQILANFDQGGNSKVNNKTNAAQPSSQNGTGYFKGGVPQQELQAVTLQSSHRQQQPIGASSNELTMNGVQSAGYDVQKNNLMASEGIDAIESFKKRNIQRNLQGHNEIEVEPEQLEDIDAVDGNNHQRQQDDDDLDESYDHALEDFENMGNVVNLQIGSNTNQDFFFRGHAGGKPPMPGKQQAKSKTSTIQGSGHTPERAGMARPPRANENTRYTGASTSSTFGSSTTANSKSWTEKQKIAAQMRQNALKYGNSRRHNLKSNSANQHNSGSRPRTAQQKNKQQSISHSHSERIFFPTDQNNQQNNNRSQKTLQQRPQTAKASQNTGNHQNLNKHRSQHEVPTVTSSEQFYSHQPHSNSHNSRLLNQKPPFITSKTPRQALQNAAVNDQRTVAPQDALTNLVIQSSNAALLSHQSSNKALAGVQKRPQTAKYQPYSQSLMSTKNATNSTYKANQGVKGVPPKKKNDPVSRYQSMQNEWSKNNFLKKTTGGNGRKLELDRFNQWRKQLDTENKRVQPKKTGTVHKVLAANKNAQAQAPNGNNRHDDLRYALRAKISQKDYVDKDMKNFHYGKQHSVQNGQMMHGTVPVNQQHASIVLGQNTNNSGGSISSQQFINLPNGSNPQQPQGNVAQQIAAAQHMLYLQQRHAQQLEEQQMAEIAQLQMEQQRLIQEQQDRFD